MKDIIDEHRATIKRLSDTRDRTILEATGAFQAAVSSYRDATQSAVDEYSAAVMASEAALDMQMEQRMRDFFGEAPAIPIKEPVIRMTPPMPPMPQASDGPELTTDEMMAADEVPF